MITSWNDKYSEKVTNIFILKLYYMILKVRYEKKGNKNVLFR